MLINLNYIYIYSSTYKFEIKATVDIPEYISQPMCMLFTFSPASFHQTKYWLYSLLGKNMCPPFPRLLPQGKISIKHPGFWLRYSPQGGKVSCLSGWQVTATDPGSSASGGHPNKRSLHRAFSFLPCPRRQLEGSYLINVSALPTFPQLGSS